MSGSSFIKDALPPKEPGTESIMIFMLNLLLCLLVNAGLLGCFLVLSVVLLMHGLARVLFRLPIYSLTFQGLLPN